MKIKELPIKVNGVVFKKKKNSDWEVLVLKRCKEDGGFWQTVTGTLHEGELLEECLVRELEEETGLLKSTIKNIYEDLYRFHWDKNGTPINEYVYAVEVEDDVEVVLSHEHSNFKWLLIKDGIDQVKTESNKKAISNLKEKLTSNRFK